MCFNLRFKYEPLLSSTSIRVLLINPGAARNELHCNFFPCDLNADHATFPECPRPVVSTSVGTNKARGRTFFITLGIMLNDGPGTLDQKRDPFQRYRALSYVRGDASDLRTIKLENDARNTSPRLRGHSSHIHENTLRDYELPSETSPLGQSWREVFVSPYFRKICIHQGLVLAENLRLFLGGYIR